MSTEQTPKTPTPQSPYDWALNAAKQLRVHGVDDGHVASVIRHHADALMTENAALRERERKLVEALDESSSTLAFIFGAFHPQIFPRDVERIKASLRLTRAALATPAPNATGAPAATDTTGEGA